MKLQGLRITAKLFKCRVLTRATYQQSASQKDFSIVKTKNDFMHQQKR